MYAQSADGALFGWNVQVYLRIGSDVERLAAVGDGELQSFVVGNGFNVYLSGSSMGIGVVNDVDYGFLHSQTHLLGLAVVEVDFPAHLVDKLG